MDILISAHYQQDFSRKWLQLTVENWHRAKSRLWAEGMAWYSPRLAYEWLTARKERKEYAKQGDAQTVTYLESEMDRIREQDAQAYFDNLLHEEMLELDRQAGAGWEATQ